MDINEATPEQLQQVGQIDGERARYLVDYRNKAGRFDSWEDVKRVPSYEDGMVERLQQAGYTVGSGRRGASGGGEAEGRERDTRPQTGSSASAGSRSHSVNRASATELEDTHMIDGERAQRIVSYRERHGRFANWDEVKDVSGIDDGIVARLKESGFGLE